MRITGKLVPGLGEGKFFLSMEHYKNEIKKKLKFVPFPGTLNIQSEAPFDPKGLKPIRIEGYTKDNKTFGGATCYKAEIEEENCAIIVPDLTRHEKNIIEVISKIHLRVKLKLNDNDFVTLDTK